MLVTLVLNGSTEAFEQIVETYKNQLFSFLLKMTFSRHDAEDILQEVFIRVYNNLYKYNERWMFSTWIYRIAINTCKSHMKRKKRFTAVPINDEMPAWPGINMNNPEDVFASKEQRREVVLLIRNLKEKQRVPLILKYVKGFSYSEIGKILGISEEAAKMRVMRAKDNICRTYRER